MRCRIPTIIMILIVGDMARDRGIRVELASNLTVGALDGEQ